MDELEADFQQMERDMAAEYGDSLSEESGKHCIVLVFPCLDNW